MNTRSQNNFLNAKYRQDSKISDYRRKESENQYNDIKDRLNRIGKKFGYTDKKLSDINNSEFDDFLSKINQR